MEPNEKSFPARRIHLETGAQAVINGALVTASAPCWLELSPGAHVFTGRKAERPTGSPQSAYSDLYFALLAASAETEEVQASRYRLMDLLGEVVMQERKPQGQRECSRCAAAINAGQLHVAVESARRLAARAKVRGSRVREGR